MLLLGWFYIELVWVSGWIGCLTSQLTIFQSYMWRHTKPRLNLMSICVSHTKSAALLRKRGIGYMKAVLVNLSRRLKCTIVITRCPSSVVRPSIVIFSDYRPILWNRWTEFNQTWQEAKYQRLLPSLCFSGRSEKQDCSIGLWLAEIFSTSTLKSAEGNSTKLDRKQDLDVLYQVCVFRAQEPKAPVTYCDHALSGVRRPSAVRLSVVR